MINFINTTTDLEQSRSDMRRFWPDCCVEYSGDGSYYSNVNGLILNDVTFSDNSTVRGLSIWGLRFEDSHLLSIPIAGHSSHQFQGQTYQAGDNIAIFHPAGTEINAWPNSHVRTFQVTIQKANYDRLIAAYAGTENVEQAYLAPEIKLNQNSGQNISALTKRMIGWLNSPLKDLDKARLYLQLFEQRFLESLVEHHAHYWPSLEKTPVAEPFYVRLAEEYIRANPRVVVGLADLAAVCGVSGRTLQLGFQKFRGYSPMEFSRGFRLDLAREMMLEASPGQTVLEIAMACGFGHVSRFAMEFRKRFQESPSETLSKSMR
jgi:AraC-like DNA-binding protein